MKENLEVLKQKYQNLWQEIGDEKLFLELVRIKEREKNIKEKIKKKTEKERKREARALIILAKLLMKDIKKEELIKFIEAHKTDFIQKDKKETVDYSKHILKLLEENGDLHG